MWTPQNQTSKQCVLMDCKGYRKGKGSDEEVAEHRRSWKIELTTCVDKIRTIHVVNTKNLWLYITDIFTYRLLKMLNI